ncbi:unnamed protein product [Amoebophrya sp. A25]|nr:unnamed protein product [Amoebophrya sp. A25]|eukprot:GSA25T00022725001.1
MVRLLSEKGTDEIARLVGPRRDIYSSDHAVYDDDFRIAVYEDRLHTRRRTDADTFQESTSFTSKTLKDRFRNDEKRSTALGDDVTDLELELDYFQLRLSQHERTNLRGAPE